MIFNYFLKQISNIVTQGKLTITYKGNTTIINANHTNNVADIQIHSDKFFTNIFSKSDIGLGESYIKQHFTTSNLLALLNLIALNFNQTNHKLEKGASWFNAIGYKILNWYRKNSIKQSAKNISYHYDLGNDFYKLWLDDSMTYSSGIFNTFNEPLEQAQYNKYNHILQTLTAELGKNLSILEIGCGFGGFAEVALKQGHTVTAITISTQQYNYAQQRLKQYIENGKCKLLLQDYRQTEGQFNAVVSIEMFEAVGKQYWQSFFKTVYSKLKPKGVAVVQTIFIADSLYANYSKNSDFIRHYIFPGGYLPSNENFIANASKNGLQYIDSYEFGLSYAKTLEIWLNTFNGCLNKVTEMGYSNSFINMWQFYLAICSAAFYNKRIGVAQYKLHKVN